MKKLLTVLFLFLVLNIYAQPENERHLIKSYTYSTVIPFELVQDLIVIENIFIDGRKGKFIFDTGNQAALVLSSSDFRLEIAQSITNNFTDTARGITGNIPVATTIKIDSVTLAPDFTFAGLNAVAFNIDNLKTTFGKNLLGFIGYGILREMEFAIDYNKKVIHLYRIDDNGNTLEETFYKRKPLLNFSLTKGSIMSYSFFAGKMLNFFLDTGAPKNALNSLLLKDLDQNYITFTGLKDTVAGATDGVIITDDALMKQFSLDDIVLDYMDTDVFPFPGNAGYDGILGYPFFKQKLFAFNYKKRQLYLCEPK
jgi:hypothetical protein